MIMPYNCVIVANGSFPVTHLPLQMLKSASAIIACDGAVESLYQMNIVPNAIVGDLDSIPEFLQKLYADRIYTDKDQETNDLTKAVQYAYKTGEKEVLILGATGLREDHTLGNISLLTDYMTLFNRVEILTDYGLFTPIHQTTTLKSKPGQQISIFVLSSETAITTEGLLYPIQNRILTSWWQGTLNEALEDCFTIRFFGKKKVIIYRLLNKTITPYGSSSLSSH